MESSSPPPDLSAGISVVICCYNSAARLPDTLRHFLRQKIDSPVAWEVVVVDNASTDGTAGVARANWPADSPVPLRVVAEPQAGLSHARRCGVVHAHFEIVSFIDDDNWVAPDWIERVRSIFATHPEVGACGGKSIAVPEIDPPLWFDRLRGYYATGSQHKSIGDVTDASGTLLWGAGLNVRTAAMRALFDCGFSFLLNDRTGSTMATGGDTELCFALREAGWRFWYDDALVLRHFIPRERLSWSYALKLMEGMGRASALFDLYLIALRRPPFKDCRPWKRTWLFQYLKTLRQLRAISRGHPAEVAEKREGSWPALLARLVEGRLEILRRMRTRFGPAKKEIANARPPRARRG